MKLVVPGVLALVVVGIVKLTSAPSPEDKAHAACENLAAQCVDDDDDTAAGIAECAKDVAGERGELTDEEYDEVTGCMAEADSCGEALGCVLSVGAGRLDLERTSRN